MTLRRDGEGHRRETTLGFAVRRDWIKIDDSHDFVEFRVTAEDAALMLATQRDQWARADAPPILSVAEVDGGFFEHHLGRPGCTDPTCPVGVAGRHHLAPVGGGR